MNRERLDRIPDDVLKPGRHGCKRLIDWLAARGWSLSLLELEQERVRRGIHTTAGRWSA